MKTISIILDFWPLWVFIGAIIFIKIMIEIVLPREHKELKAIFRFKRGIKWRKNREKIIWLRGLTPKEFEDYIAELFRKLGYKARSVGGPNDGGVDIILERRGVKYYVQCKKYFKSHEVRVGEVRDFYGALADRLATGKGYFVATSKFTLPAEEFAKDKPIELVDGSRLVEYIKLAEFKKNKKEKQKINHCPKCDGQLVKRKGKYGKFIGCSNYPKCRYIEKIKEVN